MANENGLLIMTLKGDCDGRAKGFYIKGGTLIVDDTVVAPFPVSSQKMFPELRKGLCSDTPAEYAFISAYMGARAIAKKYKLKVGEVNPMGDIAIERGGWSQTFSCILT